MVDWSSWYGGWKWAGIHTKLPYCYKFVLWWRHIKIYNQICIKVSFPSRRGWWMNEMFNLSSHRQNNFNRTHIVSTPIGQTWTIRLDQDQLANIFSNRESKYCPCRPLERLKENLSLCQMRQAVWLLWRDHTQDVTDSIIFKFAACLLFGTHLAIVSWLIGMMEAAIVNCWW